MLSYLQAFYIEQRYGLGFVLTNWIAVWGAMAVLTKHEDFFGGPASFFRWLGKGLLFMLGELAFVSLWYRLVGDVQTERVGMLVFLFAYSLLGSRCSRETCLVRASVYYTSYIMMIPVS